MRPVYRITALVLQSLGVTLLLLSIALVPQNRALAQTQGKVCAGPNTCDFLSQQSENICFTQYVLTGECPDKCKDAPPGTKIYCKCDDTSVLCKDCVCRRNGEMCACYAPK